MNTTANNEQSRDEVIAVTASFYDNKAGKFIPKHLEIFETIEKVKASIDKSMKFYQAFKIHTSAENADIQRMEFVFNPIGQSVEVRCEYEIRRCPII